jgi:hypothetical protein
MTPAALEKALKQEPACPSHVGQQLPAALRSRLQAASDALYQALYRAVPLLAGSATGVRGTIALPRMPWVPPPAPGPVPGLAEMTQLGGTITGGSSSSRPAGGQLRAQQQRQSVLAVSRGNYQTIDVAAGTVVNEARCVVCAPESNRC